MSKIDVAVVDYGMGNLSSVSKILSAVGACPTITSDPDVIRKADRIVLPGVGAFARAKANLDEMDIFEVLEEVVRGQGKPFLGICLGMQLLADESLEGGSTKGFGWIEGQVRPFQKQNGLRLPHMGWNEVEIKKDSGLFLDFRGDPTFYFTHGYNLICDDDRDVLATCDYGGVFAAAVQKDNIFGTQFHPEKSQTHGRILIENFCEWRG